MSQSNSLVGTEAITVELGESEVFYPGFSKKTELIVLLFLLLLLCVYIRGLHIPPPPTHIVDLLEWLKGCC